MINISNEQALSSVVGKRILFFENGLLLTEEIEAKLKKSGAVPLGPVGTSDQAIDVIEHLSVDAVIFDVALKPAAVTPLITYLEDKMIPFIFALSEISSHVGEPIAKFVMSARKSDLSRIAGALFPSSAA